MVAAIKQVVTVKPGGLIQIRSDQLRAGSRAEVIVHVLERSKRRPANSRRAKSNGATAKKPRRTNTARLTKQDRGDIAEVARIQQAVREGREQLIPWEQIKREMGLR